MILQYLKEKVQQQDLNHISKKLGYSNLKNFEKTLLEFSKSSSIIEWFESSHYDLVNTNEDFFIKLSKALNIDNQIILDELEIIKLYKNEIDQFKNSYIFVNTNFKRTSEPIHALAMMESKRRIPLNRNKYLYFKNKNQQQNIVSELIKEHYKSNFGEAAIWGKIKSYKVYLKDEIYHFDTNGEVIKDCSEVTENRAILSI